MLNRETMLMNGFDDCIVGIVERFNQPPIVCYDKTKVLQKLFEGGLELEQAAEHFEYNIVGAWVGKGTPCFLTRHIDCCLVHHED